MPSSTAPDGEITMITGRDEDNRVSSTGAVRGRADLQRSFRYRAAVPSYHARTFSTYRAGNINDRNRVTSRATAQADQPEMHRRFLLTNRPRPSRTIDPLRCRLGVGCTLHTTEAATSCGLPTCPPVAVELSSRYPIATDCGDLCRVVAADRLPEVTP